MPTCLLPSGLGPVLICTTIRQGRPSIPYVGRLVFSPNMISFSSDAYGLIYDRSIAVCDFSPLRAVSFSDQLVPSSSVSFVM